MSDRHVSVSRVIAAPPETIFDLLARPARHHEFDGSGTVRTATGDDHRVSLGDRFGMHMRMGLPYRISNTVVEFEDDRLIAWQHFGGHRWRYELEPIEGGTRVTETFDWSTARIPLLIELVGYPKRHPPAMERTLDRLAELVDG